MLKKSISSLFRKIKCIVLFPNTSLMHCVKMICVYDYIDYILYYMNIVIFWLTYHKTAMIKIDD